MLYSGKIKNPMTEFQEGVNTYRIIPIIMSDKNADEVIQKIRNKEKIAKEDLVSLLLTPLMSGAITVSERIKTSFRILREEEEKLDKDETQKMETVLYALASKLLDQQELSEVKEVLRMTELGKMLKAEGIAEGKVKGKAEGKTEAVLLLLAELGPVPENLKNKIESQKDVKVLENWLKLAARSKNVEDFTVNM